MIILDWYTWIPPLELILPSSSFPDTASTFSLVLMSFLWIKRSFSKPL